MTDGGIPARRTGRHKDMLYRFAWRMTGSAAAAEDLVQDSFLALWRNTAAYNRERGALRSFLIGVTRNLALKRLRWDRPYDALEEESAACGPIDPAGNWSAEKWWHWRWPRFPRSNGKR